MHQAAVKDLLHIPVNMVCKPPDKQPFHITHGLHHKDNGHIEQCQPHHITGKSDGMQKAVQRIQRHRTHGDEHAEQITCGEQFFARELSAGNDICSHRSSRNCEQHGQQGQHNTV